VKHLARPDEKVLIQTVEDAKKEINTVRDTILTRLAKLEKPVYFSAETSRRELIADLAGDVNALLKHANTAYYKITSIPNFFDSWFSGEWSRLVGNLNVKDDKIGLLSYIGTSLTEIIKEQTLSIITYLDNISTSLKNGEFDNIQTPPR
jgi:hypothetical protein